MICERCNEAGPFDIYHDLIKKRGELIESNPEERTYYLGPGQVCDICRAKEMRVAFYSGNLGIPFTGK